VYNVSFDPAPYPKTGAHFLGRWIINKIISQADKSQFNMRLAVAGS
jgi:hypothetical protein